MQPPRERLVLSLATSKLLRMCVLADCPTRVVVVPCLVWVCLRIQATPAEMLASASGARPPSGRATASGPPGGAHRPASDPQPSTPWRVLSSTPLAGGMLHVVQWEGPRNIRVWLPPGACVGVTRNMRCRVVQHSWRPIQLPRAKRGKCSRSSILQIRPALSVCLSVCCVPHRLQQGRGQGAPLPSAVLQRRPKRVWRLPDSIRQQLARRAGRS